MKIELLLEREPFSDILTQTLSTYWTSRMQRAHAVVWQSSARNAPPDDGRVWQRWLGNARLNVLALQSSRQDALRNVRTEYSSSPAWWKRGVQSCYVRAALSEPLRIAFSNFAVDVSPPIHGGENLAILGGNRRIRLLDSAAKTSTVVLKSGFDCGDLRREVAFRHAQQPALAPALGTSANDPDWFDEEYVEGVPLNRLPAKSTRPLLAECIEHMKAEVVDKTVTHSTISEHVEALASTTLRGAGGANAPIGLLHSVKSIIERVTATLSQISGPRTQVPLAATHGDFVPGNILLCGDSRVVVIDWEAVDRRHAAFDPFVFFLNTRRVGPWAQGVSALLQGHAQLGRWPGLESQVERRMSLLLCLMEELNYVVTGALLPAFLTPPASLGHQVREIESAVRVLEA